MSQIDAVVYSMCFGILLFLKRFVDDEKRLEIVSTFFCVIADKNPGLKIPVLVY